VSAPSLETMASARERPATTPQTMARRAIPLAHWTCASLVALILASLTACATTAAAGRARTAQQLARYERFAGAPIESFTYLGRYYSWSPLGPRQLLVRTTLDSAYLITVQPPCIGLQYALGIRVTSDAHTVTRRIDAITFDHQHCFISEIRPVDYRAMKRLSLAPP
jgi:Family of unknown function (DUF6491)